MKGFFTRLAVSLAPMLGLILFTLSAGGDSEAAPLNASDLPEGMAGVTWQLESMQTAPPAVVRPMDHGIVITLEFDGNGNLSGHGACNDYFAGYMVGPNNAITIGPIGSTRKACAQDLMDLDQQYFGALQTASKYSFIQGHLGFSTNNGSGTLNYIGSTPPTTSPGMPTTGGGMQLLLVLVGLAASFCLAGVGMVAAYRRREGRTVRIRIRK
jgi:heat shock protein HslJ